VPRDYLEAVHWYRKAAELGTASAQVALAEAYRDGLGVPQDDSQVAHWYRTLAKEPGFWLYQFKLGEMYANGRGVPHDDTQAVYWYRKSAEWGYAGAQDALASMYANGWGVTQDNVEAYKWMTIAAARADQSGFTDKRDAAAEKMTADQLSEAQKRASEWLAAFESQTGPSSE
jgi:TPR repeat protein